MWAEWDFDDLGMDEEGAIDVTVDIDAGLVPSTTIQIGIGFTIIWANPSMKW